MDVSSLRDHENIGPWIRRYDDKPWRDGADRMFDEWRTETPSACVLCWLRFMQEAGLAVERLKRKRSTMMRLPYLSNGCPIKHYKRRVRMEDFQ